MTEQNDRLTGARLNVEWGVGAAHALYIHDGHWYHQLRRFPGALFDRNGYIVFQTENEFRTCSRLSIGKDVSVPKPGISAISGYVRVETKEKAIRPPGSPPEEVLSFLEGRVERIAVNRYERDPQARDACIRHHGSTCVVCGFDFSRIYGPWLEGFIHVHHLTPLAAIGAAYRVDAVRDLRPICANCHAVVHRRDPPYTVDEVIAMVSSHSRAPPNPKPSIRSPDGRGET